MTALPIIVGLWLWIYKLIKGREAQDEILIELGAIRSEQAAIAGVQASLCREQAVQRALILNRFGLQVPEGR